MKRCDPKARAKCPDGKQCELYAEFADGSECDKFNEKVLSQPMTNADRIRAMSDKELAEFIMLSPEMEFGVCECCEVFRGHGAYTPCGTENGWCTAELRCGAFKKWLRQPAEEV